MTKSFTKPVAAAILLAALVPHAAHAAITPASLFQDGAVLQQKQPVPVWGAASPNEPITVSIDGITASAVASATGEWSLKLPPIPVGGPYTLTISGTAADKLDLHNILVGEVWVCSGQSNMEYPLKGLIQPVLTTAAIPGSADPLLHFIKIKRVACPTPLTTVDGVWKESNPQTVPDLTAIGYFFGRDLRKALGVPVGLIDDDWGGTPAEAWTSKDALQAVPALQHYVATEAAYPVDYPKMLADYTAQLAEYNAAKSKLDADAATTGAPTQSAQLKMPQRPRPYENWPTGAGHLFNGMISPIIPYGIRGAIWYQGEANGFRGYEYKTLLPTLIGDWRKRWGEGDFPFLFVQLAPYGNIYPAPIPPVRNSWAELREAQRLTLASTTNTGMAVITDTGDTVTVHPRRKEPAGDRLALIARALVYHENIEYSGPAYSGIVIEGANVRVNFTHADGLKATEIHDSLPDGPIVAGADKLAGFELAGADHIYRAADAVIDGSSVIVSSPSVPSPIAVRYGWADYPTANLANSAGLPASPFKSDDWPWVSQPKDTAAR